MRRAIVLPHFVMQALLLVSALAGGTANAAYTSFTDPAPGSLILTALTPAGSLFVDLGLDAQQFKLVNNDARIYSYQTPYDGTLEDTDTIIVQWNFQTGTVVSQGTRDVTAALAGVSGDWSTPWASAWSAGIQGATYGVYAADRDGPTTTSQHFLSTASSPESVVRTTSNTNLLNFNSVAAWHNNQQITGSGNHAVVANGANLVTDYASSLHHSAVGGMRTDWNGKAPFRMTGEVGEFLRFYTLDGVAGGSATKVAVSRYGGGFSLDAQGGTLTWAVVAVPEASTSAMLIAGLCVLLLLRRKAA